MPAVKSMLPLLKRGIGVHHSGLLPLLKEVVEILFQEQLIKARFCPACVRIAVLVRALIVPIQRQLLSKAMMLQCLTGNAAALTCLRSPVSGRATAIGMH